MGGGGKVLKRFVKFWPLGFGALVRQGFKV